MPNLIGDRAIEHSWVASKIEKREGKALDLGCGQSNLGLIAARKGYKVIAVDLTKIRWPYKHPSLAFIKGDLLKIDLPANSFDLIINSSTLEHIGLSRYGDASNLKGDVRAMSILRSLLKPTGYMLMTIPVGQDVVIFPLHRVYGKKRLPTLLDGWNVLEKEFWIKNQENQWIRVGEQQALSQNPTKYYYGLGLFMLQKLDKTKKKSIEC
jgi:SAM-dependent methyltransferase